MPSFNCVILVAFYPVGVRKEGLEEVTAKLLNKIEKYAERGLQINEPGAKETEGSAER